MNKQEYMNQLKDRLKHLPKEDFERAIEYYEEYFADAENEQQAIEDLGSPQEAAEQIIRDIAADYSKEDVKSVRTGLHALWVTLLALFAAPIALPLVFCGAVLVVACMIVAWALLLSLLLAGACAVIAGPLSVIAGFTVLSKSIPVFLTCTGLGLLSAGIGAAITYGAYLFGRNFFVWMLRALAGLIRKGGRNDEAKTQS